MLHDKILVTGGNGFIARHVFKTLKENGYKVLAPNREQLDVLDGKQLKAYVVQNKVTGIVHCAARETYGEDTDVYANMHMTTSVLQAPVSRIILLGSGAEYDKKRDLDKVPETSFGVHIPTTPYGIMKYCVSLLTENDSRVVLLRCFGVYGEGEDNRRFISYCILQNMKGEPIIINNDCEFDYVYAGDLARIIIEFLENDLSGAYNVTNEEYTLYNIALRVNSLSKRKVPIVRKKMGVSYTGSHQKLLRALPGFRFGTNINTGISNLISYYEERT
jgi:nucleoside-diphosphate-sugar epimerase